jgi:UTP-glucose-1-phosphate uridylyltransferase
MRDDWAAHSTFWEATVKFCRMTKPTLLVLAAGMGSRYGGLKQIDPVGPAGETIIDYSIYDAMRAGFGKLVFVIRKDIESQFREIVGARFEQRIAVEYVFQELDKLPAPYTLPAGRTKPWGTTHAILMAEGVIREPFAAINADDFYGQNAYRVLAQHLTSGTPDYAMVGFILKNTLSDFGTVARGVSRVDANNYLTHIVELMKIERAGSGAKDTGPDGKITQLSGDEAVSMNFWGFTPALFPQLRVEFEKFLKKSGTEQKSECYIPATVGDLVTGGIAKCKVLRSPDSWFGVTYREDRPMVVESIRQLIAKGDYPAKLWA